MPVTRGQDGGRRAWLAWLAAAIALAQAPAAAEVKVTAGDAHRAAVKKPSPEYSAVAKQMKVQGDVEVELKITEKGEVDQVKVITGNALLTPNVVKTVKEWKFTPFVDGGKPSAAVAQLKFSFKL